MIEVEYTIHIYRCSGGFELINSVKKNVMFKDTIEKIPKYPREIYKESQRLMRVYGGRSCKIESTILSN
jgi:hypothetical protein